MSLMGALRIVAVVALGLLVAQSLRLVLESLTGHRRLSRRDFVSEILTGIGGFAVGYGLLPAGSHGAGDTVLLGGLIVWIAGAMAAEPTRPAGHA